ncbi:MAG TPA: DNA recombination protein RmuC [Candidatus Cloacimonetes bacterium]|nr:DNA recombination protein RmuC [Candidatus Cloacimonadota bacterium]
MLEYIILALSAVGVILLFILLKRKPQGTNQELKDLSKELEILSKSFNDQLTNLRTELNKAHSDNRVELSTLISEANASQLKQASDQRKELNDYLSTQNKQLNRDAGQNREELKKSLESLSESLARKMSELTTANSEQSEKLKKSMEERLEQIRSGNEAKLEEMRKTVDEKLHESLEKRLDASFEQVSKRLEEVHKGLGEMRTLASDVGGLKKALEGVKTRGVMGEIQLEALLEDMLTSDQFERNFKPRPRSNEMVEFAISLPGQSGDDGKVYLPIDSKFPIESYYRLVDAYEEGSKEGIEKARRELANAIKTSARDIRDKYINPPITTDFGLLFLPVESLYAEVLRIDGLFDEIRRDMRVVICGPSTTAALLNSLRVGFRTLAVQKKSSEVWKLLAEIKKQFGLFGDVLQKTQKKIEAAGKELGNAEHRSRQISRRLEKVQELPADTDDTTDKIQAIESDLDID